MNVGRAHLIALDRSFASLLVTVKLTGIALHHHARQGVLEEADTQAIYELVDSNSREIRSAAGAFIYKNALADLPDDDAGVLLVALHRTSCGRTVHSRGLLDQILSLQTLTLAVCTPDLQMRRRASKGC